MAAAALGAPATAGAKTRGTAASATAGLPLVLPKPMRPPQFIVDPNEQGGDGNYITEHVVKSTTPMRGFARKHELFHTLDHDELDGAARQQIANLIAPRRAGEAQTDWWGETGEAAGARPGLAELAADYYAAAATGQDVRTHRRSGMRVAKQESAYAQLRPKRLAAFRVFMDRWARSRGLAGAPHG
jgi:hypothetical protein